MCKKRKFDTEIEAQAALNVAAPAHWDHTMRPYLCDVCRFWHYGHRTQQIKRKASREKSDIIQNEMRSKRRQGHKLSRPKQLREK